MSREDPEEKYSWMCRGDSFLFPGSIETDIDEAGLRSIARSREALQKRVKVGKQIKVQKHHFQQKTNTALFTLFPSGEMDKKSVRTPQKTAKQELDFQVALREARRRAEMFRT